MRGFQLDGWRARKRVEHQQYGIFKLNTEQEMVITSSLRIARFDRGLVDSGSKSAIRMDLQGQVDVNVISVGGLWILLDDTNRPSGDQVFFLLEGHRRKLQ